MESLLKDHRDGLALRVNARVPPLRLGAAELLLQADKLHVALGLHKRDVVNKVQDGLLRALGRHRPSRPAVERRTERTERRTERSERSREPTRARRAVTWTRHRGASATAFHCVGFLAFPPPSNGVSETDTRGPYHFFSRREGGGHISNLWLKPAKNVIRVSEMLNILL
ncbi:hypothetical protein EYF80_050511 [Liparis tanakae]|uniref:Uncharacterized protein n=1 Tax=Liparis tanakae TaxID=230148 RepID=A0A4Z2FDK0_9TELE|nr:hypothetical protein EYF80_050511 [Liparis tanakae]